MPLAAIVDNIEDVEESLREDYVPLEGSEGKYRLKLLEGFVAEGDVTEHPAVLNLKKTMTKERDRANDLEKQARDAARDAENNTITDEERTELSGLRDAREKAEDDRKRREGEFDKWRDEIADKHSSEIKDIVSERDTLKSFVCEQQVAREIATACNELGGRANILTPLVQQAVSAAFENDGVQIAIADADGTRMLDGDGKALSIAGFIKGMSQAKEFGDLFASTQKSGGGSGGADGDPPAGGSEGNPPQTPDAAARQKELQDRRDGGGKLDPRERLELSRLRGTAPTSEQLGPGATSGVATG